MKNYKPTAAIEMELYLSTCSFLAQGGDGYPALTRLVHRFEKREQDLIIKGLQNNSPLELKDLPPIKDERIQNLLFRKDTIIE